MSYTYAVLDVSPAAYREIRAALEEAGYARAILEGRRGGEIDMHGIALRASSESEGLGDLGLAPEEEAELREEALKGFSEALARMLVCWAKIRAKREISTQ